MVKIGKRREAFICLNIVFRDCASDSRLIRALRLCMGSLVILRFPLLSEELRDLDGKALYRWTSGLRFGL